jgi:hypothetical protein
LEESSQVDATDGGGGGVKAAPHLDLLSHLLDQLGGDVEGSWLTLD